ncbi:MAG: 4Fe-4S dicluster domain-containing protein [Gammaproteobacteria bacterium]|nr:4Fe-4S dicluster domain-containing protein [Gammaproteobacteria bacterium]
MSEKSKNKSKKGRTKNKRQLKERRKFLRTIAMGVGVTGASLVGFFPVLRGQTLALRPPGAIKTPDDEKEYLASCIKCGQCVQVCPVDAIKLQDLDAGFGNGTPYIDAREQACDFSCDGLQCVLACPTGSLTHDLNFPADTRMGFARLVSPARCLAVKGEGFKGLARGPYYKGLLRYDEIDRWNPIPVAEHPYDLELCDLCVRQCPIEIRITQCAEKPKEDKSQLARVAQTQGNECPPIHAIALEEVDLGNGVKRMAPVIKEGCVGCGVCEMICPPEPAAIVIDIDETADTV